MEHFLTEEAVQNSKIRVRRVMRLLYILAGLTLALFVMLCLLTRTGNAQSMLFLAMGCLAVGGLAVLGLWMFVAEPAKAEERHLAGLASLKPEIREGRFSLSGDSFRIPKSVRIRKVRLETETEALSLNLNEHLAGRMPPDGSLVRVGIARKFITDMEVLEEGTSRTSCPKPARIRKLLHAFGRFFLPAVLWAMLAVILTGFVFTRITDTSPQNKIVLYADCEVQNAPKLAEKLEKALGGAIRMVQIHPFSYAMMGSGNLKQSDLYIIPDSHREEYLEWFNPESSLVVRDPASGITVADNCFLYGLPEPYRLYTGASSVHLEDGLARRAAELLVEISDTAKEGNP